MTSTTNPNYYETNATVNAITGNVNYYGNFKVPLRILYVQLNTFRVNGKGVEDTEFVNRTINICNFHKNEAKDVVTSRMYNALMSFRVIPDKCPIKEVCIYSLRWKCSCNKLKFKFILLILRESIMLKMQIWTQNYYHFTSRYSNTASTLPG